MESEVHSEPSAHQSNLPARSIAACLRSISWSLFSWLSVYLLLPVYLSCYLSVRWYSISICFNLFYLFPSWDLISTSSPLPPSWLLIPPDCFDPTCDLRTTRLHRPNCLHRTNWYRPFCLRGEEKRRKRTGLYCAGIYICYLLVYLSYTLYFHII